MRRSKFADIPTGADNPLNAAVSARDRDTLAMVEAAVKHSQTLLAFQPIMITHNRQVGFYEGLIRVMDDTGRVIPAKDFMPVVEKAELGREIDALALNMGLRTLAENPSLRLSINMSARSIGYQNWMKTLNRWLKRARTLGARLILELTERYLKDFYFDILKIDMQFCHGIADDPDIRALTKAMLGIGHHFDMLVVGEGLERAEDVAVMAELGVDCLQGYYFDAPTVRPNWMFGERRTAQTAQA